MASPDFSGGCDGCTTAHYPDPPLLFDVEVDPSEAYPLTVNNTAPTDPAVAAVVAGIKKALARELATMTFGKLVPAPDEPGEGPNKYGVCCDRAKNCDCDGPPTSA